MHVVPGSILLEPIAFFSVVEAERHVLGRLPLTVTPFGCFLPDLKYDTWVNSLLMKVIEPEQMVKQDCKQSFPLNEGICGRKYIVRRLFFTLLF